MLTGSENYPLWKRQMELALSAKRKLGYVTGKVAKPKEDEEKIESWRYKIANGARKFKLNKESYEITQIVWDELESMNTLPQITKVTTEIAEYLIVFLNGLDNEYGILRSNILIMDPLPSVDHVTSNLRGTRGQESSDLMGKGETKKERCIHCGRDNHKSELCWEIKGYPVGHPKHKKSTFRHGFRGGQTATLQLENLLKQVPNLNSSRTRGDSMMRQTTLTQYSNDWIIDSGASNHMTSHINILEIWNDCNNGEIKGLEWGDSGLYYLKGHKK
ncbi:hypothetical protein RND81_04G070600 [Saponaria officinalis]|uniref:Retrotransposon Copia-like N-terminal domain-containing protein n=1 Tax=Saponaria officinalis TaxID=3572 RepID=A0AAW1LI75_SAPOF